MGKQATCSLSGGQSSGASDSPDDRAIPMSTTLPESAGEQDAPERVFSMLGILIKDSRARLRWAGEHALLRTRSVGCSPIPAL